jgi:hypothetical protein
MASLGAFLCLMQLGRDGEALAEALRYCSTGWHREYQRMFVGERLYADAADELREVAEQIRAALVANAPADARD